MAFLFADDMWATGTKALLEDARAATAREVAAIDERTIFILFVVEFVCVCYVGLGCVLFDCSNYEQCNEGEVASGSRMKVLKRNDSAAMTNWPHSVSDSE